MIEESDTTKQERQQAALDRESDRYHYDLISAANTDLEFYERQYPGITKQITNNQP